MQQKRDIFVYMDWFQTEEDNSLDFDLSYRIAPYFGIDNTKSKLIINEIKSVISKWREYATQHGISRLEQDRMTGAFRY